MSESQDLWRSLAFLVLISTPCGAGNILFLFGGGNLSHKLNIWPLVMALADKGHHLTFVSSSAHTPSLHPRVTDLAPKTFQDFTARLYAPDRLKTGLDTTTFGLSHTGYEETSLAFCSLTLQTVTSDAEPALKHLFEHGTFDLVILNIIYNECALFLAHRLGAKSILFSPTTITPWFHGTYGIPMEVSWIPDHRMESTHPMSFWARLCNSYHYMQGYSRREAFDQQLTQMYQEAFGILSPHAPDLVELERNASLVFVNAHYSVDFPRSLPPFFVNIGGMQAWAPTGELTQELVEFMNEAEVGVVLFTLGSTLPINTLPQNQLNVLFEFAEAFPKIRFIWRWDGTQALNMPINVLTSAWLPQLEILAHPKTIAFMTHGGLNSITEATAQGIPLIVFPIFADQAYHAYRVVAQELGFSLELKGLSLDVLTAALQELITNPKYKRHMELRSRLFKDRVQSPIEEAVYWTEFVLRHPDTSALRPMLLEQPYYVRASLDVLLFAILFVLLTPILLVYFVRQIFIMSR